RLEVTRPYVTSPSSSSSSLVVIRVGCMPLKFLLLHRVIVPVLNLIEALAVVKNGVPNMKGWELGSSTASSFSDVLISLVPFSTSFIFLTSITGVSILVSVGFSALPGVTFVLLLSSSSSFVREIEFKFFVIWNLAFSRINTFSEEVDLIFELEKSPVRCFRDALRCRNGFDRFEKFFCFIPTFTVVEGKVLNNFPRFVGILIAEFAAGGSVNLTLKMKGDMIIENLELKPTINAMMRDFLEVLWSFLVERIEQGSR
ncbi:hypothetical protein Tco_1487110, partial [Tanacetum coccineum]